MSWRFQLSKGTAADPRCEGRYRLRGFSVGCCGGTGQLCDALEGGAACNSYVVDSCHLRTGDHPGGSCGCRSGETHHAAHFRLQVGHAAVNGIFFVLLDADGKIAEVSIFYRTLPAGVALQRNLADVIGMQPWELRTNGE